MLYNELLDEFLSFKILEVKNSTYKTYKKRLSLHVIPYFKKEEHIEDLTPKRLMQWQLDVVEKSGLKISHINDIRSNFYNFIEYAITIGKLDRNPFDRVKRIKDGSPIEEMVFYTYDEFCLFISSIDDKMYRVFFLLLYFTGIRLGEARALAWDSVNFKTRKIHIARSYTDEKGKNGEVKFTSPKNGRDRWIDIDSLLYDELLSLYYESKRIAGFKENELVFGRHKPLASSTIGRRKKKYAVESGVKEIKVHGFRHSNASLLANLGVPIELVSKRLGHKNIEITYKRYIHFYPSAQLPIVNKIDQLTQGGLTSFNRMNYILFQIIDNIKTEIELYNYSFDEKKYYEDIYSYINKLRIEINNINRV